MRVIWLYAGNCTISRCLQTYLTGILLKTNWATQFFTGSMVIGLLMAIDALIYLIHPIPPWHSAFALLELMWMLICIVVVPFLWRKVPILPTFMFIAYEITVYTFISSVMTPEEIENMQFPLVYVVMVIGVGLGFAYLNYQALRKLKA